MPQGIDLDQFKTEAYALLRDYRRGAPAAIARLAASRPAAAGQAPEEMSGLRLRLPDARSCIARERGFASWADLTLQVEADAFARSDAADVTGRWLRLAYGGDVTGSLEPARPYLAARILHQRPELPTADVSVACAAGDLAVIAQAIATDPEWINRPGGPLRLPPLVAVTHSRLGHLEHFVTRLRACARALLRAGADPNQRIGNRLPPASVAVPDEAHPLSALYGAAGVNRDPALTAMLLEAGADPDDGESLYHSVENPACTRVLLQHGARVGGTNALRRALDMPEPEAIELMLAHGGDANEPAGEGPTKVWGAPLLRAIAVRRSSRHVAALLAAGADPRASTPGGIRAWRLAMQTGLTDVAELLRSVGAAEELTPEEAFVAACARADGAAARRFQARHPDLPGALPADRLRLMPDTAAWGSRDAVKVMVEHGWPVDVRGGDWDATALNHAVIRGDPDLADFLLRHGANWRERHGYGNDALGTLSFASVNAPAAATDADWTGCARALMAHGVPKAERDATRPERVVIDGRSLPYSEDVAEVLLAKGGGW